MDKQKLCKEIGSFFGDYFEKNGQLCIDNGEKIFRYNTADDLLKDWVDTLVENQNDTVDNPSSDYYAINDSWEKEIVFIYSEVIGKPPAGVRLVDNAKGKAWQAYIDLADGSKHTKNLHLGTHYSIVDAIFARRDFLKQAELCDKNSPDYLDQVIQIANVIREKARNQRQSEKSFVKEAEIRKKYDLKSSEGLTHALQTAQEIAKDGKLKSVYEAGWVNGYACGLQTQNQQKPLHTSSLESKIDSAAKTSAAQASSKQHIQEIKSSEQVL